MVNVVSFSSGLSSALACVRVLNRYGKENTKIVFLDTKFEDDDNYRFMSDFERKFDVEIIKLQEGRTPLQVFSKQNLIPNSRIAPCTFRLKIDLFKKFLKSIDDDDVTIHIGYDYSEVHRCDATKKNYESLGYKVDFPLLWKPIETRKYTQVFIEDYGIQPPRMYAMGYTHANCGGRCIKQGQGDWIRTLINFPERYKEMEDFENMMRTLSDKHANRAFLKVMRNKQVQPMTLTELRHKYLREKRSDLSVYDENASCIYCGIGDLLAEENADED